SFLAFFSAKVLRGGPKALVQLVTCFVALVLIMKLLPHRLTDVGYGGWSWQKAKNGEDAQKSGLEDDGSVAGGLRIVVFGESDVATPARLQGRGSEEVEGRSWTELLCEELNCSSYLSFVPTSGDPSRVMASTKLYATSVEQALNLTVETYGPGLDYNFMLDKFPIEWQANDLSKQVDAFLAMKKPNHSPAETLWVFSFGMWDIWSLASEPLGVSKTIVDSVVEHIFVEVERLYASATNETSIAWSEPIQPAETPSSEREPVEQASKSPADETAQFRVMIPKLFDPSLTPGWHSGRPDIPAVHSKAEQMRNAAVLTEKWNMNLTPKRLFWGTRGTDAETEKKEKQEEHVAAAVNNSSVDTLPAPRLPQRDGFLYDLKNYLDEVIVERQLKNSGLRDARRAGKLAEEGFQEVWTPCVPSSAAEPTARAEEVRICENPDDRLFYTPFAVAPRAVKTIARLAADMVRR
ncbi:hypothetical protein CONLIGDRAFT_559713, partial [Coniochaeta ligniaria NRRL 30616]